MKNFGKAFRVIVEPEEGCEYIAILPAVPGLVVHAEDEQSAIEQMRRTLQSYLSCLEEAGSELPEDTIHLVWDEDDEEAGAKIVVIEV